MLTCILKGTNSLANTLKESVVSESLSLKNKNKLGIRLSSDVELFMCKGFIAFGRMH